MASPLAKPTGFRITFLSSHKCAEKKSVRKDVEGWERMQGMTEPLGLSTYRWNNNIKSLVLLALFPCLLIALVAVFFGLLGFLYTTPDGYVADHLVRMVSFSNMPRHLLPLEYTKAVSITMSPFVLSFAAVWIAVGCFFNEGLIRMATHARPIDRKEKPELYNLLENLCISRGMKMPKLFMIDTPVMNAYASGLGESSFAITVTRGLVETLDKNELEAVLAHELSHIRHRDVRLLVVTVLFGGMLSFFAELFFRNVRFSTSEDRRNGSGAMLILAAIILSIGYLLSTLLRLALSRRREYLADAGAVELTKSPENLISALQKIAGHAAMPQIPSGVQAMLIENPPSVFGLFDTHPPIEARIAVLRRLGNLPEQGASIIPRTR